MSTGQLFITVGAIVLLTLVILRINNVFFSTSSVMLDTKFGVMAVSLGSSIIEEATSKAFDSATDTSSVSSLSSLTDPLNLGPESGEVYPNFNDFDDFNNFSKSTEGDSTFQSAVFNIKCKVVYVNPTNPDVPSSVKTWHKKLTVTVTSPSMSDTVKLSTIFSYWYFR
ncbi:hypothetical protein ABRY23_13455 [Melioribacteraceae bacterium 4301-Me]|uniref:hypothetical protein n=1 Tax=Pyranulibacter aquaticus TaxID=3163344 RepID=UPI003599D845